MSVDTSDPGHGNSPAAWTAVIIMLVGITIGTVAFFLDAAIVVWSAVAVVVVGLIVGWVMMKLGYGVGGSRFIPKEH